MILSLHVLRHVCGGAGIARSRWPSVFFRKVVAYLLLATVSDAGTCLVTRAASGWTALVLHLQAMRQRRSLKKLSCKDQEAAD